MKLLKSELALIFAMFITLTYSVTATSNLSDISEKIIRFHVVANSDDLHDQQLKLNVKDEIFEYISNITKNATTTEDANNIIEENLEKIQIISQNIVYINGYDYNVSVVIQNEFYPQKDYETFSLPSGYYNGLKINIGEAVGQNWWCVLFPPLCNQVAMDTKNLNSEEIDFLQTNPTEFRFKFIDTYETIKYYLNS